MKLVPLTVRVKAASPAVTVLGLRLVIVGELRIVNVAELESPPKVVFTTTLAVPAEAMSLAGMVTEIWVLFSSDTPLKAPFHFTVAIPSAKPFPLMVRVKAGSPAVFCVGSMLLIVGADQAALVRLTSISSVTAKRRYQYLTGRSALLIPVRF